MSAAARPLAQGAAAYDRLTAIAARLVFPCFVFGATLGQERVPAMPVVSALGQVLVWVGIVAAIELVLTLHHDGRLALVLVGLMIATKAATILIGSTGVAVTAYSLALGLLLAAAGVGIARSDPGLLHRQMLWFLALSVPLMLAQVIGGPAWIHALRTDIHDPVFGTVLLPTLFTTGENLGWSTIQARPAGFMYANNFLSIVLLLALAMHLSTARRGHAARWDWVLAAACVLAMSKIVLLALIVLSIVVVLADREQRSRVASVWLATMVSLSVYYLLFPALAEMNLSPQAALLNFNLRWGDLLAAWQNLQIADIVVESAEGGMWTYTLEAGSQSGYSAIARFLPLVAVLLAVSAIPYLRRLTALERRLGVGPTSLARNVMVALLMVPLVTSFFGTPLLALFAGLALLPVWPIPSSAGALSDVSGALAQLRRLVRDQRRFMMLVAGVAVAGTAIVVLLRPPAFVSRAIVFPEQLGPDREQARAVSSQLGLTATDAARDDSPEFVAALLRSRAVMERVAAMELAAATDSGVRKAPVAHWLGLTGAASALQRHETIELLEKTVAVNASPRTGTVSVTARTQEAGASKAMVDSVLAAGQEVALDGRKAFAVASTAFIEERLGEARLERAAAEEELARYLNANRPPHATWIAEQVARRTRAVGRARDLVNLLELEYRRLAMDAARATPLMTIVAPARVALQPESRRLAASVLLAASFALLVALVFAVGSARVRFAVSSRDTDTEALLAAVRQLLARLTRKPAARLDATG